MQRREQVRNAMRKAGDYLGQVDDSVQGFIRNKVYGLPNDGTRAEGKPFQNFMGSMFHDSRAGDPGKTAYRVEPGAAGKFSVAASRAAQTGALTGAGVGLAQLTDMFTPYGGAADQQTEAQISLQE